MDNIEDRDHGPYVVHLEKNSAFDTQTSEGYRVSYVESRDLFLFFSFFLNRNVNPPFLFNLYNSGEK